jgi:hypothetical protein
MLRKPTIADIYVKEVRTRLDASLVPVFPPDRPNVVVGTIARFVDGAFDRRGHLDNVVGGPAQFQALVPLAPPSEPTKSTFVSEGKVSIGSSATLSVGGRDRLAARVHFEGDRAVVASYDDVVEHAVLDPRTFDDLLWKLYTNGELADDEVVVSMCRRAGTGTVIVNRKGGLDVEVSVDPAIVAGGISFGNLAVGAEFGAGSQASWQLAGRDLIVGVEVKGLNRGGDDIEGRRGFTRLAGTAVENYLGSEFPTVTTDTVLLDTDFSEAEDDE